VRAGLALATAERGRRLIDASTSRAREFESAPRFLAVTGAELQRDLVFVARVITTISFLMKGLREGFAENARDIPVEVADGGAELVCTTWSNSMPRRGRWKISPMR